MTTSFLRHLVIAVLGALACTSMTVAQPIGPIPVYGAIVYVSSGQSIQTALTAVAGTGNAAVFVGPGTYAQITSLTISSNTSLFCTSNATITADGGSWSGNNWLLTNTNNAAGSLTDTNIVIQGCKFTATGTFATNGGFHHIHIRMASNIGLRYNTFQGGGDGAAMLATVNTSVIGNTMATAYNACWDHFEAPAQMTVWKNTCTSTLYGVLITGTNAAHSTAGQANGGSVSNNAINLQSASPTAGIWLNGLGTAGSGASNITVNNNTIHGVDGSTSLVCFKNTGLSQSNSFTANYCDNAGGTNSQGAQSASGAGTDNGGTPTNTVLTSNSFIAIPVSAGNIGVLNIAGTGDSAINNIITGGAYPYAYRIHGTNNVVQCTSANTIAGTSGTFNNTGATNPSETCP